jgi:hypothetical protein
MQVQIMSWIRQRHRLVFIASLSFALFKMLHYIGLLHLPGPFWDTALGFCVPMHCWRLRLL